MTSCPSEDVVVAMMEGQLAPHELSSIERHLDRCAECTALLANLARIYQQPADALPSKERSNFVSRYAPKSDSGALPSSASSLAEQRMNARIQLSAAVLHAFGVWVFGSLAVQGFLELSSLRRALVAWLFVWAAIGLPWALLNALGWSRRWRFARKSTFAYALFSILSGFCSLHALHTLFVSARRPSL